MPRNGLRIALLTAGLIAAPAFVMPARAEDPAPPPAPGQQPPRPQEGGPNQGRPEGRREGRPEANRLDPAMLLGRVADVTKELDLSPEQKTKVDESIEKAKKTLGEGGAGESRERMMAFGKTMNELKDSIEATLSEDQKKQFNEKLPMMSRFAQAGSGGRPGGPGAPGKPGAPGGPAGAGPRPEGVAGGRPGQGGGYPGGGGNPGGGGADRGAMMMQMVDAALDKVELTADQRTKIKAAVTAEMEKMRDNAGGNGGGRPAYGRPGEGRPGEGRPGEGRPSGGRPGERRPGEPRPGDDKPAPPAPAEPKDK